MDRLGDKSFARAQTAFSALVFAVFACAARIIDDDRLRMYELGDDGGAGMIYYERSVVPLVHHNCYNRLILYTQGIDITLHQSCLHSDCTCPMLRPIIIVLMCCQLPASGMATRGTGCAHIARFGSSCEFIPDLSVMQRSLIPPLFIEICPASFNFPI